MKPLVELDKDCLLVFKKGSFYRYNVTTKKSRFITKIPNVHFLYFLAKFRIFERVLRLTPRCAVLDEESVLFPYFGSLFSLNLVTTEISKELKFRDEMKSPLYLTKIEGVDGFEPGICFGEYFGNNSKKKVSIFFRGKNSSDWLSIFTFPEGEINHIHNIVACKNTNRIFVCTGDDDSSSAIWEFKNNFQNFKKVLGGSQLFRTCFIHPTANGFFYLTDAPNTQNYLVKVKEEGATYSYDIITKIDGSVIFGETLSCQKFFFSTTVEPDSNLKGWRYLLSVRKGKGISSYKVKGYIYNLQGSLELVIEGTKDSWPMGLLQFGLFQSVKQGSDNLFVYCQSIKGIEGKMINLKY